MFRHIIWDFDGTLYDTYPSMVEAMVGALAAHGCPAEAGEVLSLLKISAGEAIRHYVERCRLGEAFLADYRARHTASEADLSAPYPGIPELLRDIAACGGFSYICTHRGDSLFPMLERHGLSGCFRECVTSKSGFRRKPDPQSVLYLLEKYGIDKSEALMVGDRALDVLCGQNAGIAACDYWDGTGPRVDAAEYLAQTVGELRRVIGLPETGW